MGLARGSGCPDALDPDSDGDTLADGDEVNLGSDPCNPDTDGDSLPDNIDPFPTDPEGTGTFLENEIRSLAEFIRGVDLVLFTGPNNNANRGRRNALANKANAAANEVANEDYQGAIDALNNLLSFVDGLRSPPDWIAPSSERETVTARANDLIVILGFLVP